ncbi:MAG: NADH-quinone oxidoreductase subunit G, partial [Nocardioides sp.]|nr:NADH-quinone oxidoreductase subunit G [Nocardioides sp.]
VGRDADAIVAALVAGELGGLVIGGVDPDDTSDPAATRAAIEAASFVVALEQRDTAVTRVADVVFPVAAVVDKAGTFLNWEGRARAFDVVIGSPQALPDLRVLAGIAEELGHPLGFRTAAEARSRIFEMGMWDGTRSSRPEPAARTANVDADADADEDVAGVAGSGVRLATWKQMIDLGSLQDGDEHLRATARMPVVRVSAAVFDACGPSITLTGDRGSLTLPAVIADIADDVVWVPANSTGNGVLADLASPGSRVTVSGASA